jgi:hypothetical protein
MSAEHLEHTAEYNDALQCLSSMVPICDTQDALQRCFRRLLCAAFVLEKVDTATDEAGLMNNVFVVGK